MVLKLPNIGRPDVRYRECELGVDLPASFIHNLRSIDDKLYPIFHPYLILWDDVVNNYIGPLEDPRYAVQENSFKAGELVMGHILSNGQGEPTEDGHWHIWRLVDAKGVPSWCHVINIDCKDPQYLNLLVKRIWLQDQYNKRYGHRGYQRMMEEADIARRAKIQDEKADLMNEISKINSAMVNRAMYNFEHGRVAPTRPKKDIIVSGAGLKKRSKITRDITDREGGLILPDDM